MIDEVKRLGAELESRPFVDRKLLKKADVPILKSRSIDGAANFCLEIEGSCRRRA